MAEIEQGETNLLTTKWGPLPVWAWAGIALALAYLYSKYKASTSTASSTAASTGTGDDSSETDAVAPQFVIENNMPAASVGTTASTPVTTPAQPTPPPVVTPPGKTPAPPTTTKPPTTPPKKTTPAPKATDYTVKAGDTLTSIAAKYKVKGGAEELYTYNTTPGVRDASAIATIKKRGPNLLEVGEEILIPPS